MQKRGAPPVWLLMNLLSLDAPLVALVWQDFLSHCFPAVLRPVGRLALGLTVWAIYLTDRLLDVRRPAIGIETARHAFYRRHRTLTLVAILAILCADLTLAVTLVRPSVLENGLFICLAIAGYFAAFPLGRRGGVGGKKLLAGVLFTAGVFLITVSNTEKAWQILVWPAVAFCALCVGNLLLVEIWEAGRRTPRGWIPMVVLCLLCLGAGDSRWFRAVAASAAGLAALAAWGGKMQVEARSVLADVALLSPLLFR
jgi:hypothetical protein